MMSDHIAGVEGSPVLAGPNYGFGLGVAVRLPNAGSYLPGSDGDATWFGFAGTTFTVDPKEGLVSVLMTQSIAGRIHLRSVFVNLVYGAVVQ
jgi:CubicO group peptidase (beta-lactamase class C family)